MQGLSSSSSSAGMLLVGDAFNMRHPLTGGGMTVAFNDAVLLRDYLGPERLGAGKEGLEDWGRVSEGVREWFWKRKEVSGVVNVLSMALYSLFGGADGTYTSHLSDYKHCSRLEEHVTSALHRVRRIHMLTVQNPTLRFSDMAASDISKGVGNAYPTPLAYYRCTSHTFTPPPI
jgi:flavin-dependent dehydrogenase